MAAAEDGLLAAVHQLSKQTYPAHHMPCAHTRMHPLTCALTNDGHQSVIKSGRALWPVNTWLGYTRSCYGSAVACCYGSAVACCYGSAVAATGLLVAATGLLVAATGLLVAAMGLLVAAMGLLVTAMGLPFAATDLLRRKRVSRMLSVMSRRGHQALAACGCSLHCCEH